jgi:hypothetical protein
MPTLPGNRIKDLIATRNQEDVVRALHATVRARPDDVVAFFVKCLGREVPTRTVAPRSGIASLKTAEDPYR